MAEQNLDDPDINPAFQEMGGEAVPQRVRRHGLVDPGATPRTPASVLQGGFADVFTRLPAGKQPDAGARPPPVGAQNLKKPRRQHGIAFLTAFAHNSHEAHLPINAVHRQINQFRNTDSRRV